MKNQLIIKNIFWILLAFSNFSYGQELAFETVLSRDTVLLGNQFEIKFVLKNAEDQLSKIPDFSPFMIVGGPNSSTSMTMINGEMSQEKSVGYFLHANKVGEFSINGMEIEVGGKRLSSGDVKIIVLDNPDDIIQGLYKKDKVQKPLQKKKFKKKRKVYRIK